MLSLNYKSPSSRKLTFRLLVLSEMKTSYLVLWFYVQCDLNVGLCFKFIFLPSLEPFHLHYAQKNNSIWMIKIPATSVDKVKIIGQMHHWFISVSNSANVTQSTCSSKNLTTFLFQLTHILFNLLALSLSPVNFLWPVGWLFLSLKATKFTDNGKTNTRMPSI